MVEPTDSRPLAGVRVVVTRPARQAEGLCAAFAAAGADVQRLPLIAVVPPADAGPLHRAAAELSRFRWVVFTSSNAVRALADAADGRLPAELRAATVGDATAAALREAGVDPELISTGGRGAALAEELSAADLDRGPVLLPLATDARPDLADGLRAAGFDVHEVVAYDKRAPEGTRERARRLFPPGEPLGWVTFTSPRIARTFVALVDRWEERRTTLLAASIGPTTSAELRHLGVEPAAEAATPGDIALVAAVCRVAGRV